MLVHFGICGAYILCPGCPKMQKSTTPRQVVVPSYRKRPLFVTLQDMGILTQFPSKLSPLWRVKRPRTEQNVFDSGPFVAEMEERAGGDTTVLLPWRTALYHRDPSLSTDSCRPSVAHTHSRYVQQILPVRSSGYRIHGHKILGSDGTDPKKEIFAKSP